MDATEPPLASGVGEGRGRLSRSRCRCPILATTRTAREFLGLGDEGGGNLNLVIRQGWGIPRMSRQVETLDSDRSTSGDAGRPVWDLCANTEYMPRCTCV